MSSVWPQGKLAAVGATITKPEYRGQGIATQLIQRDIECVKELNTRGGKIESLLLSATEQGKRVYSRLGFKEYSKILSYQGEPDFNLPMLKAESFLKDEPGHKVPPCQIDLMTRKHWFGALKLANEATGLDRRQVLEQCLLIGPTSHRLHNREDNTLVMVPNSFYAYVTKGKDPIMTAFAAARPLKDRWVIGPVLAPSEAQYKAVVAQCIMVLRVIHQQLMEAADPSKIDGPCGAAANVVTNEDGTQTRRIKVQVDVDDNLEAEDSRRIYGWLEEAFGLKVEATLPLMEYNLGADGNVADVSVEGPAERVSMENRENAGKKGKTRQYAILDLGMM